MSYMHPITIRLTDEQLRHIDRIAMPVSLGHDRSKMIRALIDADMERASASTRGEVEALQVKVEELQSIVARLSKLV